MRYDVVVNYRIGIPQYFTDFSYDDAIECAKKMITYSSVISCEFIPIEN